MTMKPRDLLGAIDFRLSELVKWDLILGIVLGAGGIWLSLALPGQLSTLVASMLGRRRLIGAVIAGIAVFAAFLDQAFLKKVGAIGRDPIRFFGPFLFTVVIGVVATLLLVVLTGARRPLPRRSGASWPASRG